VVSSGVWPPVPEEKLLKEEVGREEGFRRPLITLEVSRRMTNLEERRRIKKNSTPILATRMLVNVLIALVIVTCSSSN